MLLIIIRLSIFLYILTEIFNLFIYFLFIKLFIFLFYLSLSFLYFNLCKYTFLIGLISSDSIFEIGNIRVFFNWFEIIEILIAIIFYLFANLRALCKLNGIFINVWLIINAWAWCWFFFIKLISSSSKKSTSKAC